MADNIAITPGSGATVATDDIGGVHYQLIKPAFGIADSVTVVSPTNPLPAALTLAGTLVSPTAVSVGTSATALPASPDANRKLVLIQNLGTVTVYLGASGVTTATGIALQAQASIQLPLRSTAVIYGRTASSTADVRVLEFT